MVASPDKAPVVTRKQVEDFVAAVEAEFPFTKDAGGNSLLSDTEWTMKTNGLRVPRASGPDVAVGANGVLTDGRERYLTSLAYQVVTGNGNGLLSAHQAGDATAFTTGLKVLTLELFEQSAECSGRWAGARLKREVDSKVARVAAKIIAREVKPYNARPKCVIAPGAVSTFGQQGDAMSDTMQDTNEIIAATPRHEPEVAAMRAAADKPQVKLVVGAMHEVVASAEQALIAMGGTYQRGGAIVEVRDMAFTTAAGVSKGRGIGNVEEYALLSKLSRAATFFKFDVRRGEEVVADCPMSVAMTLLQSKGHWKLPVLAAVVSAPTLRADGSLLNVPGYDKATGLLFEPTSEIYPLDEAPDRDMALECLSALKSLISTFPFVADTDRSVALSALLTACVRRSLPTAPLHAFTAPLAGSGKSKLADIASIMATGREASVVAQGKSEEETEKRLASILISGDPVVAIDNVESALGGDFLCQVLTQQVVRARILGKSEAPELPTCVLMTATGNNMVLSGDMTRRSLLCRLDPGCERPEQRVFDFDPVERTVQNRNVYVSCAITLLRAYVVAGKPKQSNRLGSFEAWSSLVRDALIWLGEADPVASMDEVRALDPKLDAISSVLTHWHEALGGDKIAVRKAIEAACERNPFAGKALNNEQREGLQHMTGMKTTGTPPQGYGDFVHPDFREALMNVAGQGGFVNNRTLGRYLGSYAGRIVNGLRLVRAGTLDGSASWKVEKVENKA